MQKKEPLIVIVSSQLTAPGARMLYDAALKLGSSASIVQLDTPTLLDILTGAEIIIYRIGPKSHKQYLALQHKLTGRSRELLDSVLVGFDKIKTYEMLLAHNLPTPSSWHIKRGDNLPNYPIVLKVPHSNQGKGVELIANPHEFESFLVAYPDDDHFLAQQFIKEAGSRDKRIIVAGNRFVAAMERQSGSDDFRSNLHLGGHAKPYTPTSEEIQLAIQAVRDLGLLYGGVDIIDSNNGPLILEVNPSPGFKISDVAAVDVAEEVIKEIVGI